MKNDMKNKILILFILLLTVTLNAQVAIGKKKVDKGGILDFSQGTTKGILLPIVETLPEKAVDGTFIMDKEDAVVKVKINDSWMDLTGTGSVSNVEFNDSVEKGNGVVIGDYTSSTPEGVLVLEAADKALILPKISDPHLNVKSPHPGMICYDTASQCIAIFDGLQWNYWK